ncbi:MAG: ribonucleoside-diphosphate reductase subunit alpha [Motiliproteus sp.]
MPNSSSLLSTEPATPSLVAAALAVTETNTKTNFNKIDNTQTLQYHVVRRNGTLTRFDHNKIQVAMTKAFLAVEGREATASNRIHEQAEQLTHTVVSALLRRLPQAGTLHIEDIQDQVELALMRDGEQRVARAYVLYREEHNRQRAAEAVKPSPEAAPIAICRADGSRYPLDTAALHERIKETCEGLEDVDSARILDDCCRSLFDGIREEDLAQLLVMSARTLIEQEPNYGRVAARLLLSSLRNEALSFLQLEPATRLTQMTDRYASYFRSYLQRAIELELLDPQLCEYDLERIVAALKPQNDLNFDYLGLQTLYDRYFIHSGDTRFELPQAFFMRVAMGLAINEDDREGRAIEFYQLLSSFDFMSSTPTLFNSGTLRPQLSSCYLSTVPDDLDGIYSALRDNALLSKFAGGLGNDWTPVRGLGAHIKGTNGTSQGVVPFLKVANDTAVAVNQGGKRKGAVCAYLESWHIDIEEFLDLRKNTGDERRRTHDMNSANWIPDLFMQRVVEDGDWTLFSPDEVPDLHELTGSAFESAYIGYEAKAARGELRISKPLKAITLWRKMLGMLFETGHPWITFKDPCNLRYTNQHVGVVHSSNLCTEITLHTNKREIAVCNLGSVNLPAHLDGDRLDQAKLERTINTAMRMLDNVIDYNYYSVPQARNANLRHRPVGLGIMGFQDALHQLKIPYGCEQAVTFADRSMEAVSYYAIAASSQLAAERGRYPSFEGSLWSQGILPIDSLALLQQQRGKYLQVDDSQSLDWDTLRQKVQQQGIRNSNCLAIAPTATIANICGVSQSIEPNFQNLFVKSNLSGEFTQVNPYLVRDLKRLDLWDAVMVNDLKYYDGSLQPIERVPAELKQLYATAFELDSTWLVEAASRRQKWIDQGQSLNLYLAEASGSKLDNLYKLAWIRGLKSTYYLRSLGATAMEKNATGVEQGARESAVEIASSTDEVLSSLASPASFCSILDPDCDACQ